jgi:DNA polymerase-3 subunit epsilon
MIEKSRIPIVDIKPLGNASHSRITEMVLIHDGIKWLIARNTNKPWKEIPAAIFALTGITNEMVSDAPIFDTISDKVFELLSDRIFVAHNVNFDYSLFVTN